MNASILTAAVVAVPEAVPPGVGPDGGNPADPNYWKVAIATIAVAAIAKVVDLGIDYFRSWLKRRSERKNG